MKNDPVASLSPGQRLGVFAVHERIGAGGMGEVYHARDTRLGRDVAVKVLPHAFTADPDRLVRLEREARVLASLSHPNVATIYGLEECHGVRALVMELVDGPTLAERLAAGPLPMVEALSIARQIADALEAAHEKGIIHRDLKPANVKVTSAGMVKVLDFGLAKAARTDPSVPDEAQRPTMTGDLTSEGLIVGTAAYMSPEQARGKPVDKRSDIWAFGCVLYEMLTARSPFAGETVSDTIGKILERDPDWQLVPSQVTPAVRRLLRRCLAKDPARRLRDIGDARIELEDMLTAPLPGASTDESPTSAVRKTSGVVRWFWASAALALTALIAITVALISLGGRSSLERPAQFTLSFAGQMTDVAATTVPVPSPDGRYFVFVGIDDKGGSSLWTRPLDSAEAKRLPGTEGSGGPIWSPDGQWIGFYADGKLKKVRISGGQPQTIAPLPAFQDGAWGSGGEIIFRPSNRQPLFRISESGGTPAALTQLNTALAENSHRGPTFLPDGRRFLFTSRCAAPENNALYIGSLDSPGVRRVMSVASKAAYIPARNGSPSALLYYRDGGLEARAFDADRERFIGDPQPVIAGVDYSATGLFAAFQASADGRLIVVRPAGAGDTQLTWFERSGEQTGTLGGPGPFLQPRFSPQGDRVAFTRPDASTGNRDIWTIEVGRGIAARLTLHRANDWFAVWSPDGTQMVFSSDRAGGPEGTLHIKRSIDSGGEESQFLDAFRSPSDWSRDGRWIASGANDIEIAGATGDRKPFPFVVTPFQEGGPRFSPDGKWIAYTSNETGRFEVFVRPFAGAPAAAEGKIQLSDGGGDFPLWRPDGRELFYMSGDFNVYAVPSTDLHRKDTLRQPKRLFRACPGSLPHSPPMRGESYAHPFDTVDGKRFLVNCTARPPGEFVVLMNWAPRQGR